MPLTLCHSRPEGGSGSYESKNFTSIELKKIDPRRSSWSALAGGNRNKILLGQTHQFNSFDSNGRFDLVNQVVGSRSRKYCQALRGVLSGFQMAMGIYPADGVIVSDVFKDALPGEAYHLDDKHVIYAATPKVMLNVKKWGSFGATPTRHQERRCTTPTY